MADIHRIRLYQSTYEDAQSLMSRWGAWGKYEGTCSAEDCRYLIELTDLVYPDEKWFKLLADHHIFQMYGLFGGRGARLVASFTVHNGSIWRKSIGIAVSTVKTGHWVGQDDFPLTLMIDTKSRQGLRRSDEDWFIMGDEDQLADHPYYKEGRPDGCKINCEYAVVTYSTRTPPAEIDRLSSFNLSCLTRFNPCTELEQLLPAATEWHLYKDEDIMLRKMYEDAEKPCAIPLWALARDSRYVLAIRVMSTKTSELPATILNPASNVYEKGPGLKVEDAQAEVREILKGTPPWPLSSVASARPFAGTMDQHGPHQQTAEHLRPGKAYIIFPIGDDRRDRRLNRASAISLDHCGVWDDTPQNRQALREGFAQNDTLSESKPR